MFCETMTPLVQVCIENIKDNKSAGRLNTLLIQNIITQKQKPKQKKRRKISERKEKLVKWKNSTTKIRNE